MIIFFWVQCPVRHAGYLGHNRVWDVAANASQHHQHYHLTSNHPLFNIYSPTLPFDDHAWWIWHVELSPHFGQAAIIATYPILCCKSPPNIGTYWQDHLCDLWLPICTSYIIDGHTAERSRLPSTKLSLTCILPLYSWKYHYFPYIPKYYWRSPHVGRSRVLTK